MFSLRNVVDRLEPSDVIDLCELIKSDRELHAMGNIDKVRDVQPAAQIKEYWARFAMMHVLHFVVEATGHLPTFPEFWNHRITASALYADGNKVIQRSMAEDHVTRETAQHALQWRMALAYYSLIREQYVISVMRSVGLEVRQHMLADVLFRTDCWIGDLNFDIYIFSPDYRGPGAEGGEVGRKIPAGARWGDAEPEFIGLRMALPPKHDYGEVYLPREDNVKILAEQALEIGGHQA